MKAGWVGFLNDPNTFWQDAEYLAGLGYRAMEGGEALLNGDVQSNLSRFQDLGLSVLTINADIKVLRTGDPAPLLQRAKQLQSPNATAFVCAVNASFWNEEAEYDACMRDIECMESMARVFAEEGVRLCYHNHFQDYTVHFGGVKFFDLLLAGSEKLCIELDTGWAQNGGEDPAPLMRRIRDRLAMVHLKDYVPGEPRADGSGFDPVFTSIGTGVLRLDEILRAAGEVGTEWLVAEQDKMRNLSPREALTCAYLNIKERGVLQEEQP